MKLTAESTVFNDDKVQSKFSELIVDADGIRTEVSKKVGNTEIISRINQSAESVKIQADKIEIDGTATFNAIKSSVESTAQATAQVAVNDIEVGGKNLLLQSNNGANYTWSQNGGTVNKVVNSEGATYTITSLPASDSWGTFLIADNELKTKIVAGETYTLSYDLMTSLSINLAASFNLRQSNGALPMLDEGAGQLISISTVANKWQHVVHTNVAKTTLPQLTSQILYMSMPALKNAVGSFSIKNIKVEKGNKATDWTPAPEDVQAEIDAKKSVHTLTSSNTAGASYATILNDYSAEGTSVNFTVTSTSGVKVGDTVRIAYKANDMGNNGTIVYIIGTVTEINNTTNLRITAHGLDTTVIDGGHILTGTIDANRISGSVINAVNNSGSGTINANKINTGEITVGSLKDGSTYSTTQQMNKAIGTAVDNIQVGGTNMLIDSTNPAQWDFLTKSAVWTRTAIEGGASFNVTTAGASDSWGVFLHQDAKLRNKIVAGQQYNISFDIKYNGTISTVAACNIKNSDGTKSLLSEKTITISFTANQWQHISVSGTAASTLPTLSEQKLYISIPALARRIGVISIKNVKVEVGNKDTDWSPAPEDVVNENLLIDSQKMSQWVANTRVTKNTALEIGEITLNGSNADWNCVIWSQPLLPISILDGSPLWLSFEYTASATTSQFRPNLQASSSIAGEANTIRSRWKDMVATLPAASSWTPFSIKMPTTVAELTAGSGTANSIYLGIYLYDNVTVKLRKLKLEHGNAPTKWAPSSEDYKTYITRITDEGISIHASSSATIDKNYMILGAGGMNVYNNGDSVALYGQTSRVGKEASGHASIKSDGFHVWTGTESTASNEVAFFGATARIGKEASGHATIKSDGLQVWTGTESTATNEVAFFGATARIGQKVANSSYIYLEPIAMTLYGTNASNQESPLFKVGNLLNEPYDDIFVGDSFNIEFVLTSSFPTGEPPNLVVKVNGTTKTKGTDYSYSYKNNHSCIIFKTAPAAQADIRVSYTLSYSTPYLSMGNRKSGALLKSYSFTMGTDCEASWAYSHAFGVNSIANDFCASAEGYETSATGYCSGARGWGTLAEGRCSYAEGHATQAKGSESHAEGYGANATGDYSHAEGVSTTAGGTNSHAEGWRTKASGDYSHAEGYWATASGNYSHAHGTYTIARGESQTAIGKYNVAQGTTNSIVNSDYAFIIGNGTAMSARSNAMTVSWAGNTTIAGTLTQSSDRRLKEHISYLDKDADEFIRQLKPAHYIKDDKHHVGFYAQDVEAADKWNCMTGEMNGFKTLGYTEIIAPLITYCQHLEKRIEELEKE